MSKFFMSMIISICCLFCSCAYKETIKTGGDYAYLAFVGRTDGAVVVVDGQLMYDLSNNDPKKDIRYEIKPGRHLIEVKRGDDVVVRRDLMFGVGTVTEVSIP